MPLDCALAKGLASGTLPPYLDVYSGYNNWKTNKLWRPIGYPFALWYENSSNPQAGYAVDYSHNPFAIYGPYGYSRGHCYNTSGYYVNATCNVYTYVP
jgi:hypothetical protein